MVFSKAGLRVGAVVVVALTVGGLFAGAAVLRSGRSAAFMAAGKAQGQSYLGIMFRDVNDSEIAPMHLKDGHGAEIVMVDHDGPAGKAGLREHDIVLSANGVTVEGEDQLRKMLHDLQPGRSVSLVICRNGAEQTVNAVMANRADVEREAWQHLNSAPAGEESAFVAPVEPPSGRASSFGHSFMPRGLLSLTPAYTGASVDAMGAQLADYFGVKDGKGLLVHDVETNSPAAAAGLHAGDVVTRINGAHVATEKDWSRALRESKGHPVSLTVVRERKEQTLTMVPDSKKRSAVEELPPPTSSMPLMMLR